MVEILISAVIAEVKEDGTMTQKAQKTHEHVPCTIEASDPEAIGVEHLLRDVKDATVSTLSTRGWFGVGFISFITSLLMSFFLSN